MKTLFSNFIVPVCSALIFSCTSTPTGYVKCEKPLAFAKVEKSISRLCELKSAQGKFSAVLTGPGIPSLQLEAVWREKNNPLKVTEPTLEFQAQVTSPFGDTLAELKISETKEIVNPPPSDSPVTSNFEHILKVIETIGPKNVRAVLCGHHLVANSEHILKEAGSESNFLLRSGLKSIKGSIGVDTVTTLPPKFPGVVRASSVLSAGLFSTEEIGKMNWEGIIDNERASPKMLSFTSPSQSFKLFFSDFE